MRSISTLTLLACMMTLGYSVGYAGNYASGSGTVQEGKPAGSYQQTCSDIAVKKGNLYARCQDEKGKPHSTKLEKYERCTSDITNRNGNLECAHGQRGAAPSQPPGSYTQSCTDIRMKGSTLHATCKSIDGLDRPTSLKNADRCAQGVTNINGILSCAVSDVLPPGSYIATCKDVRLSGTTLYAQCQTKKDRWVEARLQNANRCSGDIVNDDGKLRCTAFRRMERR